MRRKASADSLDLLLDTICNTFGGVLFIAILVCLLLRSSVSKAPDVPSTSTHEVAEQQTQLAELQARLESLQQAAGHQEEIFGQLHDPKLDVLLQERRRLDEMREQLLDAIRGVETEIGQQQAAAEETQRRKADLHKDLDSARQEAQAAIETLATETSTRTRTARLPVLRSSFKQEVAFVVRYGRLYMLRTYDAGGFRGGLNTSEFTILTHSTGEVTATPKPYAGLPITPTSLLVITERISRFKPTTSYIALAVWDDSFESFQQLKSLLIDHGYEYRLLPMADGAAISEGGSDRSVQ